MKAFCVNIPSETKRRQHCVTQYEKLGIDYEFIAAIDGRKQEVKSPSPRDQQESARCEQIHHAASQFAFLKEDKRNTARACALSHYMAWERAAAASAVDNLHHMINEDDFKIGDITQLQKTLNEIGQSPFDIVYLGYRGGETTDTSIKHALKKSWHRFKYTTSSKSLEATMMRNHTLLKTPNIIRKYHHIMQAGMTWGGHAYVMNQKGAKALMECNRNFRFLPDEALRWVILEGKVKVGMSRIKHFTCADFGSAIRSEKEHQAHHQRFSSK